MATENIRILRVRKCMDVFLFAGRGDGGTCLCSTCLGFILDTCACVAVCMRLTVAMWVVCFLYDIHTCVCAFVFLSMPVSVCMQARPVYGICDL